MKRFPGFALLTVFIALFFYNSVLAQKATQRELTIFRKGVSDYQKGELKKAEDNFRLVIAKLPDSPLITANYLMMAKTIYKAERYQEAISVGNKFLGKFPASTYRDDIYFLIGNSYYRLERPTTATSYWLKAAEFSSDPALEKMALTNVEGMIRFKLNKDDLPTIENNAKSNYARQVVYYNIAQRYYLHNNRPQALRELDKLLNGTDPDTYHYDKAIKFKAKLENRPLTGGIRIAALLPLTGANQDVGKSLLDGVKLAVKDFNAINETKVDLLVFDYKTRLVNAIDQFKKIAEDESIVAVYGPVENDIVAACAALSDYESIPMISPTATEAGLTDISPYFLQLATPVDIRGKILAAFAADSLNLRRIVTLSPIEDYFTTLTNSFNESLAEREIPPSAQEWYYPGDQDFKQQFKALKRLGLKMEFSDTLQRSDSTLTQTQIDSMYNAYMAKEIQLVKELHTKIDSADIPVTAFDGFFMPIFKEDLSALASQFAYWNISAQPLGNEDWYDLKELKKNKNYLKDLIFLSDGYLNEDSWDYRQFRNRFRMEVNKTPEKYEMIGFDSFSFILSAIDNEDMNIDKKDFLRKIQSLPKYRGIYCNYRVGSKRYNDATRLLKFLFGQIVPLN